MTEYTVYTESKGLVARVTADSVKIEDGGVLAFYEQPGDENTLESVAGDDLLIEAYAEWDRFEET